VEGISAHPRQLRSNGTEARNAHTGICQLVEEFQNEQAMSKMNANVFFEKSHALKGKKK
jgi:hypothetical protein